MRTIQLLILSVLFAFGFATTALAAPDINKAAYNGDVAQVKALLANGVNVDFRDSSGGTALHAAMFQKNMEIVELLLQHGYDINAQGASNGYTPLHDAVWADNAAAVTLLLEKGARIDIRARDGKTAYDKAKAEGKNNLVAIMDAHRAKGKTYDSTAKNTYSENDVKAFIYQWFAGFDHQADRAFFKKHLNPAQVSMHYPDFPIASMADFERWYGNVVSSIQWNAHHITNLVVSGDEKSGFKVSLDVNWVAKAYDGQKYDMNTHQEYVISVSMDRIFIIGSHKATLIQKAK